MSRILLRGSILATGSALLAGCQFGGLNSLPMPGTAGHGGGAYEITVEMPDVAKACAAVKARGGKVTREAGPVKGGTTVIAFVEDPDGYKIEFIERKGT